MKSIEASLPLLLLNSAVLTAYGTFRHRQVSVEEARQLVRANSWDCAIGHDATARLVSMQLGIPCRPARIEVIQQVGQMALVIRLDNRAPSGRDLDESALEQIGYHWAVIERLE